MIAEQLEWPARLRRQCPACGSGFVILARLEGRDLAACADCRAAFEPLPTDAPPDHDGRPVRFRKPCDNCAFHRNSPERSDPEKWRGLVEAFAYQERPFYCHKGVPLQVEGEEWPTDHGFKYPLRDDGSPDIDRLRLCAGFVAWWRRLSPESPVPGMREGDE